MLPGNVASTVAVPSEFTPPDDQVSSPLIDFERGGLALNDPSLGLNYQNWSCFIAPNGLDVQVRPGAGAAITIFQQAGIETLTFTFDQNMRPCVAYQIGLITYLRWYDSFAEAYVTTPYSNIRDPKLTLDDKRITQLALNSDIVFAYISGTNLCYRQQRDRFNIERVIRTGLPASLGLKNVGMGRNLRLQFEIA